MKKYQVIKTFGAERGFSCAFRQWRADSDCKFIHGYSLGFKLVLEAETLDDKSWVYDFGAFDHIDPELLLQSPKYPEISG